MLNRLVGLFLASGLMLVAQASDGQRLVSEEFDRLPVWTSSEDAAWGAAATWDSEPDTLAGNALRVTRDEPGSSTRVLTYPVEARSQYHVSVFMRCGSEGGRYWGEVGVRAGRWSARDFDADVGGWTILRKCTADSSPNSNDWVEYRTSLNTIAQDVLSIGFKLGASEGRALAAWDRLRVRLDREPPSSPEPRFEVSPSEMAFTASQGGESVERLLEVRSSDSLPFQFQLSAGVPWIEFSPRSGSSRGEPVSVPVRINIATLERGIHSATIVVEVDGAASSPQAVWVRVDLQSRENPDFHFPPFTRARLLRHFELYHDRSECIYQGGGKWAALETNLSHPLLRDSSRRAIGYMRAASVLGEGLYDRRAREALDYLVTEQHSDGHFTWWNSPAGSDNRFDTQYVTGTVASALADGYARYRDERYLRASEAAARWEANAEIGWNTNYVAFAMWHLAKHYGLSGDTQWLDAAAEKYHRAILPRQGEDGSFGEGAGVPPDLIGHNKRVWYHGIILRGLVELYRVMPPDHPTRDALHESIEKAVARTLASQRPSGEMPVGSGVANEHRDAFILEALLLADAHVGTDTRDAVRGILKWRFELDAGVPQTIGFNIDVQALGLLLQRFDHVVPEPPAELPPTLPPTAPHLRNGDFEEGGRFFDLAGGWSTFGYGKREAFTESGHGWVQGMADFPEGGSMGVYQIVGGFEPGQTYRVSAEVRVTRSQVRAAVGLSAIATHNCHEARFSASSSSTQWKRLSVEVTASEPWMTLFLSAENGDPHRISFDRALFDNVEIVRVGAPPPPAIGLDRDRVDVVAETGRDAPPARFSVRNIGGGTLEYRLEPNVAWIELEPSEGRSDGEADDIELRFLSAGLATGTHIAEIGIRDRGGAGPDRLLPVRLEVREAGGIPPPEAKVSFDSEPEWTSRFDAGWGEAATWRLSEPGEARSGKALFLSRQTAGSSSRVLQFDVQPHSQHELSVFMKADAGSSNYWAEIAYRLGDEGARHFDESSNNWTLVRKFSLAGENGNAGRWTEYRIRFQSGSAKRVSVGFKLGSTGFAPTVGFDELRIVALP